ncbi:MAG: histidine kinase N-terminal 7TM domain-containing protein [Lachnospiraceae bacterium]
MYQFLLAIQIICIVLIAAEILFVYFKRTSKEQTVFLFALVGLLINTTSYTYEMIVTSAEMALFTTKLSYFGKVFMISLFVVFTFQYCRVSVSKKEEFFLYAVSFVFLVFIFTTEIHGLYYEEYYFVNDGVFPHLEIQPGRLYFIYMFYVVVCAIISDWTLIKRYRELDKAHEKKLILYFGLSLNVPVLGLLIYFTGVTNGYDVTALFYTISCGIILILISKYDLFATVPIAKTAIIDNIKIGTVLLKDNEIIYGNKCSEQLLKLIEERDERAIFKWVENNKIIVLNEKAYEINLENFDEYKLQNLMGLIIHDITERYFYEKNLEQAVYNKTKEIQYIEKEFIITLANIIEERDDSTGQHVKRTSFIVKLILDELRKMNKYESVLTDQYCLDVMNAAPLHDIGKIKVSDFILNKPGKLMEEEFEKIKLHTIEGANIIESVLSKMDGNSYLKIAKDVALYHHEKWNGKGYPYGLSKENIPLAARIMSVSDVYDALITKRVYKEAFTVEKAVKIIQEESGISFDPVIVEAFLNALDKINEYNNKNI